MLFRSEDHSICFKKELISKTWFEWDEHCGYQDFEVETIDVKECGDLFLESPQLGEDVRVLYKRLVCAFISAHCHDPYMNAK